MEQMATQGIEGVLRENFSVSELATEIEKGLKFAGWQTSVFVSPDRVSETMQKFEQKAYQVFLARGEGGLELY